MWWTRTAADECLCAPALIVARRARIFLTRPLQTRSLHVASKSDKKLAPLSALWTGGSFTGSFKNSLQGLLPNGSFKNGSFTLQPPSNDSGRSFEGTSGGSGRSDGQGAKVPFPAKVKPELVQSLPKKKVDKGPSIMRGRKGTVAWRSGNMPMQQAAAAAADTGAIGEAKSTEDNAGTVDAAASLVGGAWPE